MVEEHGTEEIEVEVIGGYPGLHVFTGYGGSVQPHQCGEKLKGFGQGVVQLLIIIETNHAMDWTEGIIPVDGAIGGSVSLLRGMEGMARQEDFMAQQFYGVCRSKYKLKVPNAFEEELMKETTSVPVIYELNCMG
jgi:hypothetical protein